MIEKQPYVYVLSNKRYGTLYIGVTSSLSKRIYEHRSGSIEGFSKKHGLEMLVYYEPHATMEHAIVREKQLKDWNYEWKINLIEGQNPNWFDLSENVLKN